MKELNEYHRIKAERRKNLIFILIIIVFFVLVSVASSEAQTRRISRYDNNPEIVTILPEKPMIFGRCMADLTILNICIDSLNAENQRVMVFVYYPQTTYEYLRIGLDGGNLVLGRTKQDGNYGEYRVSKENYLRMVNERFVSISFGDSGDCDIVKNGYFFCDFLKL